MAFSISQPTQELYLNSTFTKTLNGLLPEKNNVNQQSDDEVVKKNK